MSENLDLKSQEFFLGGGGGGEGSQNISVGPASTLQEFYLLQNCPDRLCSTPSLIVKAYRVYFPWVRQAGREVTHPPPSSADIKCEWSYTPTHTVYPHDVDKENFT